MGPWDDPLYRTTRDLITRTAEQVGIDPNVGVRLAQPDRAIVVSIPLRRDNGYPMDVQSPQNRST